MTLSWTRCIRRGGPGTVLGLVALVAGFPGASCTAVDQYDECKVPGRCLVENTAKLCSDGEDNDEDGLVDCFDPSCGGFCREADDGLCSDGRDNDSDSLIDCDDPDCSTTAPCLEQGEERCSDALDQDLDGLTDCEDPDCCETRACHNMELCGNVLLDDDFQEGLDSSAWKVIRPSTTDNPRIAAVRPSDHGLELAVATWEYGCGEEVGLSYPYPLDLGMGRISIEADVATICAQSSDPDVEPADPFDEVARCAEPVVIALTPHVAGPDLFVHPWGDRGYGGNCNDDTDDTHRATNAMGRAPALMLWVYRSGYRMLAWRYRRDNDIACDTNPLTEEDLAKIRQFEPGLVGPPNVVSVDSETVFWHVRMDVDNDQVVLYEKVDGSWVELYRTDNQFPGRRFYVSFVTSIGQNAMSRDIQHRPWWQYAWIRHVVIRQHSAKQPYWRTVQQTSFTEDPGWTTDQPDLCHWDPDEQAMWFHWTAAQPASCAFKISEPWVEQPLRMRYQFKLSSILWAGAFLPGLMDPTLSRSGIGLRWGLQYSDKVGDPTSTLIHPAGAACNYFPYVYTIGWKEPWRLTRCTQWIQANLFYDPRHDVLDMELVDPGSDEQPSHVRIDDPGCHAAMPYFGITSKGGLYYGAHTTDAQGWIGDLHIDYGPRQEQHP